MNTQQYTGFDPSTFYRIGTTVFGTFAGAGVGACLLTAAAPQALRDADLPLPEFTRGFVESNLAESEVCSAVL
jgi:hypothetical protein